MKEEEGREKIRLTFDFWGVVIVFGFNLIVFDSGVVRYRVLRIGRV